LSVGMEKYVFSSFIFFEKDKSLVSFQIF
jgi:hypothetical protein